MTKRLHIATIGPAHGIRGQVKLWLHVDDAGLLKDVTLFTQEIGDQTIRLTLGAPTDKGVICSIKDITDRTAAEKLRGTKIYIDRDALPDTEDDEFYVDDLVGASVIDESGQAIGEITAVDNFGASDLLDITPRTGKNFYLPFTDDHIAQVDLATHTVHIKNAQDYIDLATPTTPPSTNQNEP